MPRRKRRGSNKSADEDTHLSLRIGGYEVRSSAGINHYARNPQYAWRDTRDEPLYKFETHLEVKAICIDPKPRAGKVYNLTIYGDADPESHLYRKLKNIQALDENRSPQYRTYRGKRIPIYKAPLGMGSLEKVRGAMEWQGYI